MDRKLVILGFLLVAVFFSYDLDPLGLKARGERPGGLEGASQLTSFFTLSNPAAVILPAFLFLMFLGLLYFLARKQEANEEG